LRRIGFIAAFSGRPRHAARVQWAIMSAARPFASNTAVAVPAGVAARAAITKKTTG
jgi:hypothetical protein